MARYAISTPDFNQSIVSGDDVWGQLRPGVSRVATHGKIKDARRYAKRFAKRYGEFVIGRVQNQAGGGRWDFELAGNDPIVEHIQPPDAA